KLEPKNVDHPLTGNWVGFRDCHIKPDLVLIYRVFNDQLQLARIGSHSDLF
ncbi:type II toxin-antitoxin system YafQ family toxin, partial [Vibrio cholerae]